MERKQQYRNSKRCFGSGRWFTSATEAGPAASGWQTAGGSSYWNVACLFNTQVLLSEPLRSAAWVVCLIGNMSSLAMLHLSANMLSGTIPDGVCELTALNYLNVQGNDLSGSIPSCICELAALTELDMYSNHLIGSIPSCIGISGLKSLTHVNLHGNGLSGTIPDGVCESTALTYLNVRANELSGSLPSCICELLHVTKVLTTRFCFILFFGGTSCFQRYNVECKIIM